jgi:hypothetical protein
MAPKTKAPEEYAKPSVNVLNQVFQALYELANGNTAKPLTRVQLEKAQPKVPKESIFGCVIVFHSDGYIVLTKGSEIISQPKNYDTDYNEFRLSANGAKTKGVPPYKEY